MKMIRPMVELDTAEYGAPEVKMLSQEIKDLICY